MCVCAWNYCALPFIVWASRAPEQAKADQPPAPPAPPVPPLPQKNCVLPLAFKWYQKIALGEKEHELRKSCPHWTSRLAGATHLVFQLGLLAVHYSRVTGMNSIKVNLNMEHMPIKRSVYMCWSFQKNGVETCLELGNKSQNYQFHWELLSFVGLSLNNPQSGWKWSRLHSILNKQIKYGLLVSCFGYFLLYGP